MTTSIDRSRTKFRWAALAQLVVVGHTVLAAVYASTGQYLYLAAVMIVIVLVSYAALSLAFEAGAAFPSGER